MTKTSTYRSLRRPVHWRDAYLDFERVAEDGEVFLQRVDADGWESWGDDDWLEDIRKVVGALITVGDDIGNTAPATILEASGGTGWWIQVHLDQFDSADNWPSLEPDDDPLYGETASDRYSRLRKKWGPNPRSAMMRDLVIRRARAGKKIPDQIPDAVSARYCVCCLEDYADPDSLICHMCAVQQELQQRHEAKKAS